MCIKYGKSTSFILGCLLMVILGCGEADDGSRSYHVLGTVKYKGKPVPAGRIDFFPDSSKGNQGPSGYATIANGHFSTLEHGKATIAGHIAWSSLV